MKEELDPRRRRVLDVALATFQRFGFRKTSMEEVARAAGISRQGLYLSFATKEALFVAAIEYAVEDGLTAAVTVAKDESLALEDKLVGLFDAWTGRYVGMMGEHVTDLHEATLLHGGELLRDAEARFLDLVIKVIRGSKLPVTFKASGLSARELAETLQATARGLKTICTSREDFGARMRLAVRVMCR
ncbi:MAG: TetR/AcrR family transcriptional regulator [Kofleriaceae bacterium]|nr:TetR/AcrR family transcriptional regulator [Kofleriaceae bacterium]